MKNYYKHKLFKVTLIEWGIGPLPCRRTFIIDGVRGEGRRL